MGKKSIFLLPVIPLPEGENMSKSFQNDSIVQLWQFRVKPTSTTTFTMLVGLAGKGHQVLHTLSVGTRVSDTFPDGSGGTGGGSDTASGCVYKKRGVYRMIAAAVKQDCT